MTKVKNVFFLVLAIIQNLINCIILLPRKFSLVVTLIFMKKKTWIWSCNIVGQKIPIDFNGGNEEEMQQAHQQQVPTIPTIKDPQNEAPTTPEVTTPTIEYGEHSDSITDSCS